MGLRTLVGICICFSVFAPLAAAQQAKDFGAQWAQWRGPEATGVAKEADPPVLWDEKTNIKWKVAIPGTGHASPIVWKDRVIVLTSAPTDKKIEAAAPQPAQPARGMATKKPDAVYKYEVLCLDRKDGSVQWRKTVAEKAPHAGTHPDGSWASGSPVTDGERIYALFGSNGLYCLDMEGKVLWDKQFGEMTIRMNFGEGASPVLCEDRLIVNWDHEKESFIVALDKKTGKELWKVPREERTSWATPVVATVDGKTQIITCATKQVRAYDAATGTLVWECGGMTENVVPCPIAADGRVWLMSGFRGAALVCVQLAKARGNLDNTPAILWKYDKDTPYVPSPLLYENTLYFLKGNSETISALDAKTGKVVFGPRKIEGLQGVYPSPVAAKGRIYVTGRNGVTAVLQRGPEYKVLASNALDDSFTASAALAGKEIFLRGHKALYCIGAK